MSEALEFEASWWGDCRNTFHEEEKQTVYAEWMGLELVPSGHPPTYQLNGSVIDVGGGPVSLLLKTVGGTKLAVADPCEYPKWVGARYRAAGIRYLRMRGEDTTCSAYDEAWCYNVLQHVEDPEQVIVGMLKAKRGIRIFEWLDLPAYEGHPNALTANDFDGWFKGYDIFDTDVFEVNDRGAVGRAFAGWVPTG